MWFGNWEGEDTGGGGGSSGGGSNTCGVGGWGGPKPGDPSNNSILTATPAFGGIDITWSLPTTNSFAVAYTKLYRGLSADFNTAILIAEVGGSFYYDRHDTATRYYYWIRIVSVNGTVGELIGPASAVAKPTIEGMIELLTGQIDSGLLAMSLKGKLDQISILNSNLLNEITDRETGDTTLAEAMADVQLGMAEAHTFILNEINTRTTQNSAMAERIDGVVAAVGGSIAAVITSMFVSVDATTGQSTAMHMTKVTVNGLVGGFGLINNGATVEAGFDVDRFWVGRTSADKRKPFIIDGGVVYIDEGAINKLTFSKLRDESGSFIVQDGKVKAEYLHIGTNLSGGSFTEYAWPGAGTGFYLGPEGFRMGNLNSGAYFGVTATGDVYAPHFSIINGNTVYSGDLSAARISVGQGIQATRFFDNANPLVNINSSADGLLTISAVYTDVVVYTTNEVLFKNADSSWPIERRIRSGVVKFFVTATASVDDQLSVWYRIDGGSWVWMQKVSAGGSGDTTGAVVSSVTLTISANQTIQFGVTPTDQNLQAFNMSKLYLKDCSLLVQARNF